MVMTKKSAQAAAQSTDAAAVLSQFEEADQPVAPIPNGRTGNSMDADNEERERVATLYRGIRTLFFETYGYYPKDQILQEEGYKHLASREFGINLMLLGGKRSEVTGEEKEAAYLGILSDLGIDLTPFKTPTVTGKSRFNWCYYRSLSYTQAMEIKNKILSAFSADLRKDV